MLLVPCTSGRADWAWRFYNSDGSDAEMCGNGARCFARFIQRVTGWPRPEVTFETLAGVIHATLSGDRVTIGLTDPANLRLHQAVPVDGQPVVVHSINTGVPHAVVFVPDADKAMVQEQGSALRHHPHFQPRGTNVNFAQLLGHGRIRVRTYERGVEGETLACGTGVTATALVAATIHGLPSPVRVQVQGGDELEVAFDRSGESFKNVRLNGPATFVFEGRIHV
jgi:diaminopimelate epimerase